VVHQHVVLGRVAPLDVVELTLLVDVDQDVAVHRLGQTRALDLARLEDRVAVGQDGRRSPGAEALQDVERVWVEAVRERVVDQEHDGAPAANRATVSAGAGPGAARGATPEAGSRPSSSAERRRRRSFAWACPPDGPRPRTAPGSPPLRAPPTAAVPG